MKYRIKAKALVSYYIDPDKGLISEMRNIDEIVEFDGELNQEKAIALIEGLPKNQRNLFQWKTMLEITRVG